MMTFGSLFAGIGGFDLGLERALMRCAWQVEIDPFCQKVLAKHWPNVKRYGDVRDVGQWNLEPVDLVCGGFPCQPFSNSGERRGEQDDRNLWPEMRRIIDELRPRWVIAENVLGIRNIYLETLLSDLESMDYTTGVLDLPAIAFGAPHIRHRFFVVANSEQQRAGAKSRSTNRCRGQSLDAWAASIRQENRTACTGRSDSNGKIMAFPKCVRLERLKQPGAATPTIAQQGWWNTEPFVGRVADGVSTGLDRDRLRVLGNAVVPQVAEWIGQRIVAVESNC